MSNSLWVEKYRPDTLEGYVGNEHILEKVKIYIQNEDVPHLLLYGQAGTGKTTLAKIITNQIDCDLMYINASDENSVDAVRDKIRVDLAVSVDEQSIKVVVKDRRIDVHSAGVHEPKVIVLEAHVPPTVMGAVCLVVVERVVGVFQMDCVEVDRAPLGTLDQNSRPCILVRVVWDRALKNDGKVFGAFSH